MGAARARLSPLAVGGCVAAQGCERTLRAPHSASEANGSVFVDRKPEDWIFGQQAIADVAEVSDKTLRERIKRFDWRQWLPRKPMTYDGVPYGKPIDQSVVQSVTNAAASASAVIAAEMPSKRSEAGRASGEARRKPT